MPFFTILDAAGDGNGLTQARSGRSELGGIAASVGTLGVGRAPLGDHGAWPLREPLGAETAAQVARNVLSTTFGMSLVPGWPFAAAKATTVLGLILPCI